MIQLVIVDDDPFIRESLKLILDLDPDLTVIGTCGNGEEGYRFVQEHPETDIVLMDIRMPGCDGVEGTRLLKTLDKPPAVLILTTFDDDEYIVQAIRNGANGYLLKNVPPARIVSGIKSVAEGNHLIHPDIARKLAGLLDQRDSRADSGGAAKRLADAGLTPAEQDIVRHIADGKSNKEIAGAMFLSEGTVKNYISEILGKLGLRDRTQIAIFYLKESRT
ncbi:DNA-binding response regulator [Cohnella sp. CIP 111063]|jgi:DNA-binding NarL/FixJ family response regulator|uniref:response regulator n=1 Tax=unclassified Cohnella TaxID=2636738 RepID=UPI000B8BD372|nr:MULTISPECIES: response regulator transcription factor [unclassified Cohnella]OXS62380.1 DNA-binding response regulator [Cohnella sp. CIP 111063]PRX74613.1 LuxR family two component transcriptional regulator [Cohnella sp. SGD-V74]